MHSCLWVVVKEDRLLITASSSKSSYLQKNVKIKFLEVHQSLKIYRHLNIASNKDIRAKFLDDIFSFCVSSMKYFLSKKQGEKKCNWWNYLNSKT